MKAQIIKRERAKVSWYLGSLCRHSMLKGRQPGPASGEAVFYHFIGGSDKNPISPRRPLVTSHATPAAGDVTV